jgi:peptidoglycan/xylan/chitin deacetylase (PgdA/CDA1 family)
MTFRVALTFDAEHPDRPHRIGGSERVLDRLDASGVTATFFIQGRWAEAFPELARSLADRGHLIGNHSFYHARMPLLSAPGLASDVRAAERAIVAATGVNPRPWFRCPFGAGSDDPTVRAGLARLGYREIGWDVEGFDWHIGRRGRGMAREMVAATVAHGDGAVLLLHPWTTATEHGLEPLIDGLRDAGATFVRLDALA